MDYAALVTAADRRQDLLPKPHEVRLELRQDGWRGEIPGERLVAMEYIPRIFLNNNVDGVQQTLKVAFLDKRRSEVGHDEIADESDALIRQMDQQRIVSFSTPHRNELNSCSADLEFRAAVDGNVRLEVAYVFELEAFAEEFLVETTRCSDIASNFFLVVAARIKAQARIQ